MPMNVMALMLTAVIVIPAGNQCIDRSARKYATPVFWPLPEMLPMTVMITR